MSGLPVEHARHPEGGALCGSKRKWGVLIASGPQHVNCKRCQRKIREQEQDPKQKLQKACEAVQELLKTSENEPSESMIDGAQKVGYERALREVLEILER